MTITRTVYESVSLYAVMREMQPPSNYWLSTFFPETYNSLDEWIEFGKISMRRKLAPLVVPTAQGRPIYDAAESVFRVKPAYLKPKDPVSHSHMLRRRVGSGELTAPNARSAETPQSRYNATVADIQMQHREAIERRWEWMAAEAILYGMVTLEAPDYPATVVDFGRPGGHSITLDVDARWGDAGVSILEDIEAWRAIIRNAPFGGMTNRLTVGAEAWEVMRADDEIKALMKNDIRLLNSEVTMNLGLTAQDRNVQAELVGRLGPNLDVYLYSDWYEEPVTGTETAFMSPKDVLLSGPNVNGVRAFGAILDQAAQFQAVEIFPKMWNAEDPPVTFIMNQSAPLMVPFRTENTLRARVVA